MKLKVIAKLSALATALGSQILMGYVFFSETFFRRGVLFYEPNLTTATIEFITIMFGIGGVFWVACRVMDE